MIQLSASLGRNGTIRFVAVVIQYPDGLGEDTHCRSGEPRQRSGESCLKLRNLYVKLRSCRMLGDMTTSFKGAYLSGADNKVLEP
jgi:hypothetical protein